MQISFALTLRTFCADAADAKTRATQLTFFGAMLFARGVSGTRCVYMPWPFTTSAYTTGISHSVALSPCRADVSTSCQSRVVSRPQDHWRLCVRVVRRALRPLPGPVPHARMCDRHDARRHRSAHHAPAQDAARVAKDHASAVTADKSMATTVLPITHQRLRRSVLRSLLLPPRAHMRERGRSNDCHYALRVSSCSSWPCSCSSCSSCLLRPQRRL